MQTDLRVRLTVENNHIQACVPVPDRYPNTAFAAYCRQRGGCFGELSMYMQHEDAENDNRMKRLPWNNNRAPATPRILWVDAFNVHSQSSDLATNQERRMLKGMGKRMMCAAVHKAVLLHAFDPKMTFVSLQASSYRSDESLLAKYMRASEKDLLYLLLKEYPTALYHSIPYLSRARGHLHTDLAGRLADTEATIPLIEYYKRTYGFSLWQVGYSPDCRMGASIETILAHCR